MAYPVNKGYKVNKDIISIFNLMDYKGYKDIPLKGISFNLYLYPYLIVFSLYMRVIWEVLR